MIAAGRAAEFSVDTLLLEKTGCTGNKVLVSGRKRCNLTNAMDVGDFIAMYGANGRFLYQAFHVFFRDDLLALLHRYGVRTTAEPDGRIFPSSNKAADVVVALNRYASESGVDVAFRAPVTDILVRDARVVGVQACEKQYTAAAAILATGGMSYPGTGSSGDGYRIAEALGHSIVPLRPALVPLEVDERELASSMQGVSLSGVRLTSYACWARDIDMSRTPNADFGRGITARQAGKSVIESRRGAMLFTHFGIGGPTVIQMSLAIVDALHRGPVSVSIDLKPDLPYDELRHQLQEELDHHGRRRVVNLLATWFPEKLANTLVHIAGIDGQKSGNQVSASERDRLLTTVKSLCFNIKASLSISQAMVTAGGVSLDEIDPRTMASKIVHGLYFCGEVVDLDAETGGFNLQAAFSTGYLAGQSAAAFVKNGGQD